MSNQDNFTFRSKVELFNSWFTSILFALFIQDLLSEVASVCCAVVENDVTLSVQTNAQKDPLSCGPDATNTSNNVGTEQKSQSEPDVDKSSLSDVTSCKTSSAEEIDLILEAFDWLFQLSGGHKESCNRIKKCIVKLRGLKHILHDQEGVKDQEGGQDKNQSSEPGKDNTQGQHSEKKLCLSKNELDKVTSKENTPILNCDTKNTQAKEELSSLEGDNTNNNRKPVDKPTRPITLAAET